MNKKIVFFIGAGFTKAIAKTAPTGSEFLTKAFDPEGSFSSDQNIQNVKKFVEKNYYPLNKNIIPNIEDLLSLIDYTLQRNEALSKEYLYNDVVKIKNELIYLIGKVIKDSLQETGGDRLSLSRDFINEIIDFKKEKNEVAIISTNYDIILDNSLIDVCQSCDYGTLLRNCINYDHSLKEINKVHGQPSWYDSTSRNDIFLNNGDVPLLKIHGSLNWFYCPKCDEIDLTIKEKGATMLADTQSKFICVNRFCTSFYEPLLVTPTMLKIYKNSFLKKIWNISADLITEAEQIIFIGYSLPDADYHIRSMLTKSLIKNDNIKEILVIEKKPNKDDPKELEWQETVKKRYESLFGTKLINFQPIGLENLIKNWKNYI